MSIQNYSDSVTYKADSAINQYGFVKQSSGAYVTQLTSGATRGAWIALNATTGVDILIECAVEAGAQALLKVDGAYSVGQELMAGSSGFGTAATANNIISAIQREASTASGDIVVVEIAGQGGYKST